MFDPFEGFDLESRIVERANASGVSLKADAVRGLADHARAVLRENEKLHLTTIVAHEEFVERHLGEAFEGACLLPSGSGTLLDLGSGNGYPGLALGVTRPDMQSVLAEASVKRAAFLRSIVRDPAFRTVSVLESQIQRGDDLMEIAPVRAIVSRAVGGWAKILPRLASCVEADGAVLVWAGEDVEVVVRRKVWRRYELVDRRALPGREASWVWKFRVADPT